MQRREEEGGVEEICDESWVILEMYVYLMHHYLDFLQILYVRSRMYVTSSHLRSKEFISIHKPCIPHSRDTTKCTPVYIQM